MVTVFPNSLTKVVFTPPAYARILLKQSPAKRSLKNFIRRDEKTIFSDGRAPQRTPLVREERRTRKNGFIARPVKF
jgi:hypothetical protein